MCRQGCGQRGRFQLFQSNQYWQEKLSQPQWQRLILVFNEVPFSSPAFCNTSNSGRWPSNRVPSRYTVILAYWPAFLRFTVKILDNAASKVDDK